MTRRNPPSNAELARRIDKARQRMNEAMGTIPSSEGGGAKGSHGDRTASIALNLHNDIAYRDSRLLDKAIKRLATNPSVNARFQLDDILRRWELTDQQAEGLRVKGDDSGAGWCQSHWRVGSTEPPRTQGSKLCRWCEDWTRRINDSGHTVDMPPRDFVDARARGAKWSELIRHLPAGVVDA